jgi:type VI secretion system secreted protein Hcp
LSCAKGKSFAEIVFTVRKDSGDAHLDYLIITLTNCIISGYKMNQSASESANQEMIAEEITVSYEKLNFKYVVQADDHSKGDEHEVEYDLVSAK